MNIYLFCPAGFRCDWSSFASTAITKQIIMRTLFIGFFVALVIVPVTAESLLAQKITIRVSNSSLYKVIDEIRNQSGYDFLIDQQLAERSKPITLDVRDASLKEVLEACFKAQPFHYELSEEEKTVIIRKKITFPPLQRTVSGRVIDSIQNPLVGATIQVKNTLRATFTDENGQFTVRDVPEGSALVISFLGYATRKIQVTSGDLGDVVLAALPARLTEVQVNTGYQILSKERATGSYTHVDSDDLDKQIAATDIGQKFQNLLPGVLMAGGGPIIRGKSTINANQSPIIVVDGFPTELSLSALNPQDVASITVLRDAAAASIWGVRASNGVIVITTKHGKVTADGRPELTFSSTFKLQDVPPISSLRLADASQYIDAELEALSKGWFNLANPENNRGYSPVYEIFKKHADGLIGDEEAEAGYDALRRQDAYGQSDLFFRQGLLQQYNLSIAGTNAKNRYYISANYQKNKPYSRQNQDDRLTLVIKNRYAVTSRFGLDVDLNLSYIQGISNGISLYQFVRQRPYERFVDESGNYLPVYDPYRTMEKIDQLRAQGYYDWSYNLKRDFDNNDNTSAAFAPKINVGLDYRLIDGLLFASTFQYEQSQYKNDHYLNEEMYEVRDWVNKFAILVANNVLTFQLPRGPIYHAFIQQMNHVAWRNQLTFGRALSDPRHRVDAILGTEINRVRNTSRQDRYHNYDQDKLTYSTINETALAAGVRGWNGNTFSYPLIFRPIREVENRYFSLFFNASYDYDARYTFSVSARVDKSNLLGAHVNDKMTPLYSIGGAWNVARESFFNVDAVDDLRLRVTTGINGNIDKSTSKVLIGIPQKNASTGEDFLQIEFPENKDLRWESTLVNNLGIDLALFGHRLNLNVDVYRKKSYDLLGYVDSDPSVGFHRVYKNTAQVLNTGYDLQLTGIVLKGAFGWRPSVHVSYNKNRVTKVFNPNPTFDNYLIGGTGREIEGKPIDYFYSFDWAGLSDMGEPQVYNDEGKIVDWQGVQPTTDWLVYSGTTLPKYHGALINTFSYKRFTLTPILIYQWGHVMRLPTTFIRGESTVLNDIALRWRSPGDETRTHLPRMFDNGNEPYIRRQFYASNTERVADASFVRLSNLSLTYDVPFSANVLRLSRIQIQAQASNVVLWTKNRDDVDPEAIDRRWGDLSLTAAPTYTLGLKLDF